MFVRSSKFRHVFGNPTRKEQCYEGIRVTKSAHDSNFCAVNPKFLAVVLESAGGGAFLVLPLEKTGRIEFNVPKVCGHRGPVTDIKWNPFDDHIIASASEDTTVKLWEIPNDGLTENLSKWETDLQGHYKRVNYIEWHPTAANILLSAGADFQCILWNVSTGSAVREISAHSDVIFSISWNRDGSLFATTSKDKLIRVIDPRNGNIVAKGEGHTGSKASKVVFLGAKNLLFTTGFSRTSERQYAVWDTNQLSKPLKIEEIDSSSGLLIPFYDYDTSMVYLAGKGDGNIRYMEIVDSPPYAHYLSQFQSSSPQRGFGVMPKRGVDTSRCEVFRFYKLHTLKEICEPISMIVPRKSEVFQADIYPPTAAARPALSADEWLSGQNREPALVSLKDGVVQISSIPLRQASDDKSFLNRNSSLREKTVTSSSNRIEDLLLENRGQNSHIAFNSNTREPSTNGQPSAFTTRQTQQQCERKNYSLNQYSQGDDDTDLLRASNMGDNSFSSPPLRATVQRAATFHGSSSIGTPGTPHDGRYGLSPFVSAQSTNRLNLGRNASLMSEGGDISDLPVTPASQPPKVVRRHRRRRRNEDSSSCSSMEDLDTLGTAWTENPLYSQGKSPPGRRKNGRMSHRRAPPLHSNVDLGPLNEVLNCSEFRSPSRPLSKSSCDLVSKFGSKIESKSAFELASRSSGNLANQPTGNSVAKSSGDLVLKPGDVNLMSKSSSNFSHPSNNNVPNRSGGEPVSKSSGDLIMFDDSDSAGEGLKCFPDNSKAAGVKTGVGVLHPKAQFRSEPDVAKNRWTRSETEQNKSFEPLMKPLAPLARAEDDTIFEDELSGDGPRAMIDCISVDAPDHTLIKPSLLRASMNSRQRRTVGSSETVSTTSSSTSGLPLRRAGSLRETKSSYMSSSDVGSPLTTATPPSTVSPPSAEPSAFQPVFRQSRNTDVVISGRKVIPPNSVPPPPRFVLPGSGKNSALPNPFVFTVPVEGAKKSSVSDKSNGQPAETLVNGAAKENNDDMERQKLLDLCKRQSDEIQLLKQQLNERDAKIRLLQSHLQEQTSSDPRHRAVGMTMSNV